MEISFATFRQEDKVDANVPPATKGSFLTGISAIRRSGFGRLEPLAVAIAVHRLVDPEPTLGNGRFGDT